MDNLEEKLGAVLNNPQMMQQIMALAQNLGQSNQEQPKDSCPPEQSFPQVDMAMLQRLAGFAQRSGVDRDQRQLLSALGPYLSRDHVTRLEKAMRAAKLARLASTALSQFSGAGG